MRGEAHLALANAAHSARKPKQWQEPNPARTSIESTHIMAKLKLEVSFENRVMGKSTQEISPDQVKSKKRVPDHGEVFTAQREVNAMLNLVSQETERIDSRFLEPAFGTGNFLVDKLKDNILTLQIAINKA